MIRASHDAVFPVLAVQRLAEPARRATRIRILPMFERRSVRALPALRLALCCLLGCSAMPSGAQGLPPEPSYKGELTGDGKGGVVVRPFSAPEVRRDTADVPAAAPPGRSPRPERQAAPDQRQPATPQAVPEPQRDPAAGPQTLEVGPLKKYGRLRRPRKSPSAATP